MRHRLFSRAVALVLIGSVALPATAHGLSGVRAEQAQEPASCSAARVEVRDATVDDATGATLCLLNRERAARGLEPLRLDPELSRAAAAHSLDMVRRGYFDHASRDGRSPFQRMLATRYVPRGASWSLGENIGWGTTTLAQPQALVKAWMASPGHRANILNGRFREIGIGVAIGIPMRDRRFADQPGATYTTDFGQHS